MLADLHLVKRGPGMHFSDFIVNQKRVPGMEFVGKRSEGIVDSYNLPVVDTQGWGETETMEKRAPGMEFVWKRAPGMEFVGKRAPGMEFVGKRAPGMEFVGKRSFKDYDYAKF
jgi:hypothetical protein